MYLSSSSVNPYAFLFFFGVFFVAGFSLSASGCCFLPVLLFVFAGSLTVSVSSADSFSGSLSSGVSCASVLKSSFLHFLQPELDYPCPSVSVPYLHPLHSDPVPAVQVLRMALQWLSQQAL